MEAQWELDRLRLYQLVRAHPDWSRPRLAAAIGYSVSWVKKWLRRFRAFNPPSLSMFKRRVRVNAVRPRQVMPAVRDAILSLRDELKAIYGRVVGPKPILYHLHEDTALRERGLYLPRSPRTIWQVLRAGGRIPTRVREHHPLTRPEPLQHWEMDFGEVATRLEFLTVMDRGTSSMVKLAGAVHYNAASALLTVAQLLLERGLPAMLRFDNDPRFVGNWLSDGFPSPLMRFLWCLGVEPDLVASGKPQHKPFAERSVRTVKYECLSRALPEYWSARADMLDTYATFFNHGRANQSLVCGNRPPYVAFPTLPTLPAVPDEVDPDAWLAHYHRRVFRRRVGRNGMIAVGRHDYYVGYRHAGTPVGVLLDAKRRVFTVLAGASVIAEQEIKGLVGQHLPFQDYLQRMLEEARTLEPR